MRTFEGTPAALELPKIWMVGRSLAQMRVQGECVLSSTGSQNGPLVLITVLPSTFGHSLFSVFVRLCISAMEGSCVHDPSEES